MNSLIKLLVFFVALICSSLEVNGQATTISGTISDLANGEPLGYALVYIPGTDVGVSSNDYGYYSLSIDPSYFKTDSLIIEVKMMGYPVKTIAIKKGKSVPYDISLSAEGESLQTIEIIADAGQKEKVSSTQMSSFRIPMKDIKKMPGLLGETDIIKIVQLMPGVQKGGEGGTGMFVRGGTADQNLVLLDEATVYNIGHLFGFFSVFNQDALHDMIMIKGAFPSEYGGRLSSILDISMKEGDLNKVNVAGGVGLLSSRLTIDGPIKKEKASFLISARRTYIDKLFSAFGGFLPYYFYDFNAKANWKISAKDRIFFSTYIGKDILAFDSDDVETNDIFGFGFELGNMTNTIRWNRIHSSKLFTNLSLIHTKFNYDIGGKFDNNNVLIKSDVRDIGIKSSVDFYWTPDLKLTAGFQQIGHIFKPNVVSTSGEISTFLKSQKGTPLYSQEFSFYKGAEMSLLDGLLKLNLGLRTSGAFVPDETYVGLEPRWSARYLLNEFSSLKFGYSRMKQYMHLVSSSSVSLPTDLWYPVTADVSPQRSDQFVLAWHSLLKKLKVNTEVELYYKHMKNLIEYREGTNLILNNNFEEELVQGSGDSWGVEFLAQRQEGRITGWVGYTLSWATRQFDELNRGRTFWAKYDRRHNLSVVCNISLSKRWDFSAVWVYSSGSRITPQIGQYFVPNASFTGVETIPVYTERNAVSMSASHRLDINFILKPRPNKKKKLSSEWHFGAYNFYNRATPYRIEIVPATTGIGYQYQQPGLFGFIPSIAYNFQF